VRSEKAQALEAPRPALPQKKTARRAGTNREREHQKATLLDEYYAALARKQALEAFFQRTTDPDLIASCIFELNAAEQQYGYILGRLKAEGVTSLRILRSPGQ